MPSASGRKAQVSLKARPNKSLLLGRWHIVSMGNWDEDDIDEEVPAFIEFEPGQTGEFHFGYVRGGIDYRDVQRDGKPAVEFPWDGNDEMDPAQGRGWAVLDGGRLRGMIFFHHGDESELEA